MQSLYRLSENSILYSVSLSCSLQRIRKNIRIVRAFDRTSYEGVRVESERMIDTLVKYIASNPSYIVEWADIPLLFVIAYLNFRAVRLFCTSNFNVFGLLDFSITGNIALVSDILCTELMCSRTSFYIALERLSEVTPENIVCEIICMAALNKQQLMLTNGLSALMMFVPVEFLRVIFHITVSSSPSNFIHVPDGFKTLNMCMIAVHGYSQALLDVPMQFMTRELCMEAVKANPQSIECVPDHIITADMCECAIQLMPVAIEYVPERFITLDMFAMAVFNDLSIFSIVPYALRTSVRCSVTMRLEATVARFTREYILNNIILVDNDMRTISENPEVLRWLPENSYVFASTIVDLNWEAIAHIPLSIMTYEMCIRAFKNSPLAFNFIPYEFQTASMCKRAVEYSGILIQNVSAQLKTKRLVYMSVKRTGIALKYVPEHKRSSALCKCAVHVNSSAIMYVPQRMRNQVTIGVAVVKVKQGCFEFVPKLPLNMQNAELWRKAVYARPRLIKYVPRSMLSAEMCDHAVEYNVMLIEHVPIEFRQGRMLTHAYSRYLNFENPMKLQKVLIEEKIL